MTKRKRKLARTLLAAAFLLPIPVTFSGPAENQSLLPQVELNDACGQSACCEREPGSVCVIDWTPNFQKYTKPDC
ncbi:MAG: hypothetical protein P8X82_12700 [Gemmatimonadales bacterium]|jgi:hypothetical protein